jgi:hypothetical protein
MYYSAGVVSVSAFGTAVVLPHEGVLWLIARLMLDGAGALFGLYLVIGVVLSMVGGVVRLYARRPAPRLRPQK